MELIYIKEILKKHNKNGFGFISYLCDKKRNHNLNQHKGKELVRMKRNGEEGKIYIDPVLLPLLNEYLKI